MSWETRKSGNWYRPRARSVEQIQYHKHGPLTGDSGLPDGLVRQGAAARHNADLALLVDIPRHDSWQHVDMFKLSQVYKQKR